MGAMVGSTVGENVGEAVGAEDVAFMLHDLVPYPRAVGHGYPNVPSGQAYLLGQ